MAKHNIKKLLENRIPLTSEERATVMNSKAVWHHGKNGAETPAVSKHKDSKGNTVFLTHTHRAAATAPTLKGAIRKYHTTIKDTA
jgi:hypothetical protein